MVPAESEFQGFRRMMRDLVRDQGKAVEFRVTGFEVLADRMVLQALKDPLMHVLRNAVTHGIEPPDERRRSGKPPEGLVTLAIRATGNRLTIEVEDDGRGVDLARVSEFAVRRGLLPEAEARSAAELAKLLFLPGFSTSGQLPSCRAAAWGFPPYRRRCNGCRERLNCNPAQKPARPS